MHMPRKTCALLLVSVLGVAGEPGNQTRVMLDSIARLVDGTASGVSDAYFDRIMACMTTAENLVASHDGAWAGFASYYSTNGTGTDSWGGCNAQVYEESNHTKCKQYKESNYTHMDAGDIGVFEPCNSASNLAYYRTAIGVCDHANWAMGEDSQGALIQSFIHLAMGSFFWHGSHSLP